MSSTAYPIREWSGKGSISQQGFTLTELVAVIVVIGVLAATAAPKFLNFSSDARIATLKGAKGALASTDALVYGKSILQGAINQTCLGSIETVYGQVGVCHGHLEMHQNNVEKVLGTDLTISTRGIISSGPVNTGIAIHDGVRGENFAVKKCFLHVCNHDLTGELVYDLVDSGC